MITVEEYLNCYKNLDKNSWIIEDYNIELIRKYPFLRTPLNEEGDFSLTWMDSMLPDFRIYCGDELLADMKTAIDLFGLKDFKIFDVKRGTYFISNYPVIMDYLCAKYMSKFEEKYS